MVIYSHNGMTAIVVMFAVIFSSLSYIYVYFVNCPMDGIHYLVCFIMHVQTRDIQLTCK